MALPWIKDMQKLGLENYPPQKKLIRLIINDL